MSLEKRIDNLGYNLILYVCLVFIGGFLMGLFLWFPWTYMEMGEKYFEFLPPVWRHPPFKDCFLLSWILIQFQNILGRIIVKRKVKKYVKVPPRNS